MSRETDKARLEKLADRLSDARYKRSIAKGARWNKLDDKVRKLSDKYYLLEDSYRNKYGLG